MLSEESILKLAAAIEGGSFANEYTKRLAIKSLFRVFDALTDQDIADLWSERMTQRFQRIRDLQAIEFAFRAGRNPTAEQVAEFERRFR